MDFSQRTCEQCGTQVLAQQSYCPHCGTSSTKPGFPPNVSPNASPLAPTSSVPSVPIPPGNPSYAPPVFPPPPLGQYPVYMPPSSNVPYGLPGSVPPRRNARRGRWIALSIIVSIIMLGGIIQAIQHIPSSEVTIQAPTQPPLFSDSFADNSHHWPTEIGSGYSSQISNGGLLLKEANSDKFFRVAFPGDTNYSDFRLDMTFLFQQGDAKNEMGLEFRRPDNVPLQVLRGYIFVLNSADTYTFIKALPPDPASQKPTNAVSLGSGTLPASLTNGQPVTLTVIAKGANFAFYVNGAFAVAFTDTTYTSGSISIAMDNKSALETMEVVVQHIAIYAPPAQIPTPAF